MVTPGRILITPGALADLDFTDVTTALRRHMGGDWGEVCAEDWAQNDYSLKHDLRLLSTYTDQKGTKFWIITEADRSATTILLPDDY